jgi:hypothetical protein
VAFFVTQVKEPPLSRAPASSLPKLPKGTLKKLNIGQSFAEYDIVRDKVGVVVETPAMRAAVDKDRSKCLFVGRRGTGKTAITFQVQASKQRSLLLLPQLFSPVEKLFSPADMENVHQRPFKTLVTSFKRALVDEVVASWVRRGLFSLDRRTQSVLTRERNAIENLDFDLRLLQLAGEGFAALNNQQDKEWQRFINRTKEIIEWTDELVESDWETIVLLDRIDESWDGTDNSVVIVMALMHACVELTANSKAVRPLVFLRENVFERVREVDREFARLETFVVALDWSREMLFEMIERRLNLPLIAKYPLHGPTWDAYFEQPLSGTSSSDLVFEYCQSRPRDVLIYCKYAIEAAQRKMRERVQIEDLHEARRVFSDNRLKELGDEYADNYPQLRLVLSRFHGLGQQFTIQGIDDFIRKLLVDSEIKIHCQKWIFKYTQPDLFVRLLYDIGFAGVKDGGGTPLFRTSGPQVVGPPPIGAQTMVVVHPTYVEALNLGNRIVDSLAEIDLIDAGLAEDLPESVGFDAYQRQLITLQEELKTLPHGDETSSRFEDVVGEIIKLCFFRSLTNVEPKSRTIDQRVVRDWVAANHASDGFWQLIRQRYNATQIIWECKNYVDLTSSDFHQASYYMNEKIGKFAVLAFRGTERKKYHFEHTRRIAEKENGIVLLLTQKDLEVFVRQGINGKSSEAHIQELYDLTVRNIS